MSTEDQKQTPAEMADMTAVFNAEIAPLMEQLVETCKAKGLPAMVAVQYSASRMASQGWLNGAGQRMNMAASVIRTGVIGLVAMATPSDPEDRGAGGVQH